MRYVHYGCGLCAPKEWVNYDASYTLRIQRIPVMGRILSTLFNHKVPFPKNVLYGDIEKGLPESNNSVDGVYCSQILDYLSLEGLRAALKNTYSMMKDGSTFRLVVTDLEYQAKNYISGLNKNSSDSAYKFIRNVQLGKENIRKNSLRTLIFDYLCKTDRHLWIWDYNSLSSELKNAGFKNIRRTSFHDFVNPLFNLVEEEERFKGSLAIEAMKLP